MSKPTEENKQKVKIKWLVSDFNLHWKFVCVKKNNDKNKAGLSPLSSTVFLNATSITLKFSDFQFVFVSVLWKIKHNCMSELFCMANFL